MKKVATLLLLLYLLLIFSTGITLADDPFTPPFQAAQPEQKIAPEVQQVLRTLPLGEMLTVIVTLREKVDLQRLSRQAEPNRATRLRNLVETLQAKAKVSQQGLKTLLATRQAEGRVGEVIYFWIFNGLAVTAVPAVIQELAARPEVFQITPNEIIQAPSFPPSEQGEVGALAVQANLSLINVPALWDLGYQGQGIVVANMDTGVDYSHPNLGPKWRGGANSWYDPYGQHATPVDLANPPGSGDSSGHGTQTMGIMVGDEDNNGVAFGLAPAAQWIAAKVFKDDGSGTTAGFHAAFQWLLDPDNNPATPDAPHVVNNSWTYGGPNSCVLEFQADLQALRAAGILPIFSAGNTGPSSATSQSPANYPEALAVGGTTQSDGLYTYSSRGPSACDGAIFPDVVAPGVSIHTTDRFGAYTNATGTSFAAPHVAGALALLLDAYPGMTVAEQENALTYTAVDLVSPGGAVGPDNTYGLGRIDVWAALQPFSANLAVTQSASAGSMTVNSLLTYTINITNSGPATATAVILSDLLPAGVILNGVTFSQGNCSGTSTVTCNLGDLSNGTEATVTISVRPATAGLLTNTVTITSSKPDLVIENNAAVTDTSVTLLQLFLPLIIK